MRQIPFLDLKKLNDSVGGEVRERMENVLSHGRFINGPEVGEFEKAWARYCGTKRAVGCSNGTSALHAILAEMGVGPGDEVIMPSHTFVATAEAVRLAGAVPVFAEINEATMLADPASIQGSITDKTKAIIAVHLYGAPADMDAICEVAKSNNLKVVEDAAQAHGALYKGRKAGSLGDAAAFSFFPGKNLGAFGDAGAVAVNNEKLGERIRLYVNHGRESKYEHLYMGTNYRLDTLQAAILQAKLPHLDKWNAARRALAGRYREVLAGEPFASLPFRVQSVPDHVESSYHLFVVRVPDRDRMQAELKRRGIATGIHYPIPCHLQPSMADVSKGQGSLPATEKAAGEVLSLPMCPTLSPDAAEVVCEALRDILKG